MDWQEEGFFDAFKFSWKTILALFYDKVIILSGLDTGRRQNSEEEAKEAIPLPRLEIPSDHRHGSY